MKFLLQSLVIVLAVQAGFAQTASSPFKSPLPASPTASEIGKYGEIPVNLSTGILNYSIPITAAKSGSLTFPISLNYSYSGYRPNEEAGWVGRGWNLSAGGVIIRTQRSLEDERGYNGGNPNATGGFMTTIDEVQQLYSTITPTQPKTGPFTNLYDEFTDAEPDIFTVSCGKLTGKFYYGYLDASRTQKGFIFTSRKNIKIDFVIAPQYILGEYKFRFISFTITDEEGTKYIFDKQELSWAEGIDGGSTTDIDYQVNTWHITSIETQKGEKIEFIYENKTFEQLYNFSRSQVSILEQRIISPDFPVYNENCGTILFTGSDHQTIKSLSKSSEIVLTQINSRENTIIFSSTQQNKPIQSNATTSPLNYFQKLNQIELRNISGQMVRQWDFKYFSSPYELLLKSLTEKTPSLSHNSYSFSYHNDGGGLLDRLGSQELLQHYSIDNWGYYNGFENLGSSSSLLESYGAIRIPQLQNAKIGSLSRIKYPTGGYTDFEYDLQQYSKMVGEYATVRNGPGQPSYQLGPTKVYEMQSIKTKRLFFKKNPSTGQWGFEGNADDLANYTPIAPSRCVINSYGSSVCYPLPSDCSTNGSVCCSIKNNSRDITLQPSTIYDVNFFLPTIIQNAIANVNNPLLYATVEITIYETVDIRTTNFINGGGIRIKAIRNYNWDGTKINEKEYRYEKTELGVLKSSGQIYTRPLQEATNINAFFFIRSSIAASPPNVLFINKYERSNPMFTMLAFSGNYIVYDYVLEIVNGQNYKKHYFNNIPDYQSTFEASMLGSSITSTYGNIEFPDFAVGINKKTEYIKNGTSTLLSEVSNFSNILALNNSVVSTPAIHIEKIGGVNYPFCNADGSYTIYYSHLFTLRRYDMKSYRFDLLNTQKEEIITESPLVKISQQTDYTYNSNHYFPSEISTTKSDGSVSKVVNKYPLDYVGIVGITPWLTTMINNNIVSPVIEVQNYLTRSTSTQIIGAKLNTFKINSASIAPSKPNIVPDKEFVFVSDRPLASMTFFDGISTTINSTTNPNYREVLSYDDYDKYGNVTQLTPKDNFPISYLWSYKGNFPVASIQNATIVTVNAQVGTNFVDLTDNTTIRSLLTPLNTALPGALIDFNLYNPSIGVIEKTSPNGITNYFNYDALGRLQDIKNNDGNVVKSYQYNYTNTSSPGSIKLGINYFYGNINLINTNINLNWQTDDNSIARYEIYRSINGSIPTLWKTITNASQFDTIDSPAQEESLYQYKIQIVYTDGSTSLQKIITVNYPASCGAASNTIETQASVPTATFKEDVACKSVRMLPGFHAQRGSSYNAKIKK